MPEIIEHIDAISRKLQRDVLYVVFHPVEPVPLALAEQEPDDDWNRLAAFDWHKLPTRQQVITWLVDHGINWKPCGHFTDTCVMMGYRRQIYIDLPFDEALPAFQALQALLELNDGSMRFPEATFICCPRDMAMENAAHDVPSFWVRWTKNF